MGKKNDPRPKDKSSSAQKGELTTSILCQSALLEQLLLWWAMAASMGRHYSNVFLKPPPLFLRKTGMLLNHTDAYPTSSCQSRSNVITLGRKVELNWVNTSA